MKVSDAILVALIALVFFGPFFYLFLTLYIKMGSGIFIPLMILTALLYALVVYSALHPAQHRPSKKASRPVTYAKPDPAEEAVTGIMGAVMIGKAMKKRREKHEKERHDSLFWQDAARDKEDRGF